MILKTYDIFKNLLRLAFTTQLGIISGHHQLRRHQRHERARPLPDVTIRPMASERRQAAVDLEDVVKDLLELLCVEELRRSPPAGSTAEPQVRVRASFVDLDPKPPHAPFLNDFKSHGRCRDTKPFGVAGPIKSALKYIRFTLRLHEDEVILDGWVKPLGEEVGRAMRTVIEKCCLRGSWLGRHELFNHAPQLANAMLD
jgi:hypothetical protein